MTASFYVGVPEVLAVELQVVADENVHIVRSETWEHFKELNLGEHVVYLPNFILNGLLGSKRFSTGWPYKPDKRIREKHGLPALVVSGNMHGRRPAGPDEAARRLAMDIVENVARAKSLKSLDPIVAIWTGFIVEPISLTEFVKYLGADESKYKARPTYRELLAQIELLKIEQSAVHREEVQITISKIKEAIDIYDLKPSELFGSKVAAKSGPRALTDVPKVPSRPKQFPSKKLEGRSSRPNIPTNAMDVKTRSHR